MLRRGSSRRPKPTSPSPSTMAMSKPMSLSPSAKLPLSNSASSNISPFSKNAVPQDELIERTRLKIPNAHIFKLPPAKPASGGWRGADWKDKVWQGTLKVVERGEDTAVLLVDAHEERNIFAVCPIVYTTIAGGGRYNGVDRCVDSSRYFVLRIQNAQGQHMFIGLAFNERNDAFDFNTALEDSWREKEVEKNLALAQEGSGKKVDYRMKDGEKIRVSIPKGLVGEGPVSPVQESEVREETVPSRISSRSAAVKRMETKSEGLLVSKNKANGGFLPPCAKDTPSRLTSMQ